MGHDLRKIFKNGKPEAIDVIKQMLEIKQYMVDKNKQVTLLLHMVIEVHIPSLKSGMFFHAFSN